MTDTAPAWLTELAASSSAPRTAASNRPLDLDDPRYCWLVESGGLDVFVVDLATDGARSGFRHALRVLPGRLAFGAVPEGGKGASLGLHAKGIAGTTVRRIAVDRLLAEARRRDGGEALAAQVDAWIRPFAAGVASAIRPMPRIGARLTPGSEGAVEEGRIAAARGVVWIGPDAIPGSLFLDLEPVPDGAPTAITRDAWVTLAAGVETHAIASRELAPELLLGSALARFHELILGAEGLTRRLRAVDFANLQVEASHRGREAEAEGKAHLAALFHGPAAARERRPLMAALEAVGRHSGMEFRAPPLKGGEEPGAEQVFRATGVQARRVRLRRDDAWWRSDSGAMLGRGREDGRPIALIPRTGGYRAVDPASGSSVTVNAGVAAGLEEMAWLPYPGLPSRRPAGWRDLGGLAKHNLLGDALALALAGVVAGLLAMAPPVTLGALIERVIPTGQPGILIAFTAGLLPLALVAGAAGVLRGAAAMRLEARVSSRLTAALWDRLVRSRVDPHTTAGDSAVRATVFQRLRDQVGGSVAATLLAPFQLLPAVCLLFLFDVWFGLLVLGFGLAPLLLAGGLGAVQTRAQRRRLEAARRQTRDLLQFVAGIVRLRQSGAEGFAYAAWARRYREQKEAEVRVSSLQEHLQALFAALPALAGAAIFLLASRQERGAEATGDFLVAYLAAMVLFGSVIALGQVFDTIAEIGPSCEQVGPVLARVPESTPTANAPPVELSGEIRFDNVRFKYAPGAREILQGVSIHVRPGEFVAIVGESGAGKSTLIRLALGLDEPSAGAIYYDGRNLAHIDRRAVRRHVGVVMQEQGLMPGSILENIVGTEDLDLTDAWGAAKLAGVARDIAAMPMGMHTSVGDAAVLSGGQTQGISLAAALVRKPRILFLDEATSWLDRKSQAQAMAGIESSAATRIVIAHRLSTIRRADRIHVLESGRVVQSGNYQALMAEDGPFRRMATRQMAFSPDPKL